MTDKASGVKETAVADVQLNDDGAPSQVNGYRVLKQLGEGTTSKVYQCQDESGRDYALKILNKSFLKRKREYKKVDGKMVFSNAFQKVQKEVAIMKKLSHENLVKLHEIIDSPADDKMVLVLELITGGQVMKFEEKGFRYRCPRTASGVMAHEDVRRCMRDVIGALEYLHKNSICHRDIKPENILLAGEDTYKLADFGVAHMTDDDSGEKKTLRNTEGTYHFLAPECTTGSEYDPYRVDIWALGVTMFTMLFGALPFGTKAASLTDVMDSIRVDPLVLDSEAIEAPCEHLLRAMMTKDVDQRITIEELKRHPWILEGAAAPKTLSEPARVEVTREEIEAAFTPVNNFILMVRIKMKMAGRLARARNSIDLARSQSPAPFEMRRTDSQEALPVIEHHAGDAPATAVSPAVPTTQKTDATPPPTSSASTSPGKGAMAKLARRLSFKGEAAAPAERRCDSVAPTRDAASSPSQIGPATLSKRKSALDDKLVIEDPADVDEAKDVDAISRIKRADIAVALDGVAADSEGAGEPRPATARVSPSRITLIHLSPDTKLPKLEIGSSPSGSPASSPIHRKLTPRYSRDNVASGWDEPADELSVVRKSPNEKRLRSPKLHQGVVHPAPPSAEGPPAGPSGGDEDLEDLDEATETITVLAPPHRNGASPVRKKTQDEAKAAISSIIHRTNTETTSPSASPVKEPSVMLQRRKSSLLAGEAVEDHKPTASELPVTAPALPRLLDQPAGRPRLQPSSPTRDSSTVVGLGLGPTTQSPRRFSPGKSMPSRARTSERSLRSERSVCSNGRASTYATEYIDGDAPEHRGGCDPAENKSATTGHGHGPTESAKTPRVRNVRENSLTNCLPKPNDSDLFLVDPATRHVRKYNTHDEAGSDDAEAERDVAAGKPTAERSPPKVFGLFRKTSGSNVAPLDLIPDLDAADDCEKQEEQTPARREHEHTLAPVAPKPRTAMGDAMHAASAPTTLGGGGDPLSSPTTQDLGSPHAPRRAFSPRKSAVQSQESIRLLVLRRSESVKAMLTGRKTPLEAADDSLERHRSLAAARAQKGPTAAAVGGATSPRKSRAPKSASCIVQ